MPGKRKKGKKKRKRAISTVFQCFVSVIDGCRSNKKRCSGCASSPISVKEEVDQYSIQTLEIAERHEPRVLHKIESKTTNRPSRKTSPLNVKRRALNNNLPILENLEVANMRIIFRESKHASWLIPYMCEKDDTHINKDVKTVNPTMLNAPGQASESENEFNEVCASSRQSIINTAVIELEEEDQGKAQIEYEEKLAEVCRIFTESIICDAIDEVEEEDNEVVTKKSEKDVDELCILFAQLTISEAVDEFSAFTQSIIDTTIDEMEQRDREAAKGEFEEEIDKQRSVYTQSIIDAWIDGSEQVDRKTADGKVEEEMDEQWSAFTLSIIDAAIDEVEQEDREAANREIEAEIDKQSSAFTQSIIDTAIDEVEQEDREAASGKVEEGMDEQWSAFTQSTIDTAIDEVEQEDREAANRKVEEEIDKQWSVFTQSIIDAAIDEVEQEDREAATREVEEEIDKQWSAFTQSIIDAAIDEVEQEDREATSREVEDAMDKQWPAFTQPIIDAAIDEVEQEDRESANREVEEETDKQLSAFTQSIIDAAIDDVEQEDREAANRKFEEEMDKQWPVFTQSIFDAAIDEVEQEDRDRKSKKILPEVNTIRNAVADLKEVQVGHKATAEETSLVERIVCLSTSIEKKADVLIQSKEILSSVARSRSSQLIHSGHTEDSSLTSNGSKSNKRHFNMPLKGNEALDRARPYLRDIVKSKLVQKLAKETYIAESTIYAIAATTKEGIVTLMGERITYMQPENKVVLGVRTLEHHGDDLSKHEIEIDEVTGDMNVSASNAKFKDHAWNPEEHRKDVDDFIEQWEQSQGKGSRKDGKTRNTSGRTIKKGEMKRDTLDVYRIEEFIGDYFKKRIEVKRNATGNRDIDDIEIPIAKDILGFFFPPWIDLETRERIRKHQVGKDFKYEMTWEWNETDTYRKNEDTGEIIYENDNDIPYTGRLKNYMKKTKECLFYSDISYQVMDQTAQEKSPAGNRLRSGLIKCAQLEDRIATMNEEEKKRKEQELLEEKVRRVREEEEARIKKKEEEQEQRIQEEKETAADSETTKTMLKKYAVQYTCLMGGFYLFELEIEDLVAEGKFGKTYEGYYNGDPVEVMVFAEGYPKVDPGSLLSLKSHFVSRVLVHLQNEKELNCLIYTDCYLGTLWDLMQADANRRRLGEAHAVFVLTGLMEGIRYISSKNIIHAHLTPDLVKFNNKGYPVITFSSSACDVKDGKLYIAPIYISSFGPMILEAGKYCDFSFAYSFKKDGYVKPRSEKFNVDYSAPEIGRWKKIVPESDIFSAGCIAYEIVEGLPPFTGDDDFQTVRNVFDKKFKVDYDPEIFSEKAKDSISVCLRSDADDRTEWEDWYLFRLERDIDIEQKSRSPILPLIQKLLS